MTHTRATLTLLALALSAAAPARGEPPKSPAPDGWKLVWADEFDGPAVDRAKWGFDLGNGFKGDTGVWYGGWGNNEQEFYTDRPENAFLREGALHIRAVKESYEQFPYTSARLVSKGKFEKCYGRFEFRAKMPIGWALWPALWMMPAENTYGPWASSGEIDMVEIKSGVAPTKTWGTLHFGSRWPRNASSSVEAELPGGGRIDEFHVYTLDWEPGAMRWYVDGTPYSTQTWWWSSNRVNAKREGAAPASASDLNPWPAPFDKPFYLIMNLAVGGPFAGGFPPGDARTGFTPARADMVVDYVRVYDKVGGYGPTPPPAVGNAAPAVTATAVPDRARRPDATVRLHSTAKDDGKPSARLVSETWSEVKGPGPVTFGKARDGATTATFPEAGTYVLRFTAFDGLLGSSADVTVVVEGAGR